MADQEIKLVIKADGGVSLKNTTKEINRQRTAVDNLGKSKKRMAKQEYGSNARMKQGAIQTANSTKNFSKLQQSVDGGGGAGGLVRAYALLAANVFALSAAFGVLSRSAQVDTLTDSMKQLEIVSGNSVRAVARDLQEASGFGLDFADSMRSTSLALSAGFDTTAITELGEVARNAAVSLGRPMGDALDRIFRGVIKVEPELLDEIGLFVRVKDASAKYASELGIAASELTEFQKRQAFANEAIRQGQEKFEDFSEIPTDPYSQLAAAFSDIAQNFTSILNSVVGPLLSALAASKGLMTALFLGIAGALLSKAIPALGLFTQTQKQQAAQARLDHLQYVSDLDVEGAKVRENMIIEKRAAAQKIQDNIKEQESRVKTTFGGKKRAEADIMLKQARKEKNIQKQITAIEQKQGALLTSSRKAKGESLKLIKAERNENDKILKQLEKELRREKEINRLKKESAALGVKPGSFAAMKDMQLGEKEFTTSALAGVVGKAETRGMGEAFKELGKQTERYRLGLAYTGQQFTPFKKGLFQVKGAVGILGTSFSNFMMKAQPWILLFTALLPLLHKTFKGLGLWSAEAKALEEQTTKTSEAVDIFNEKLKTQGETIRDPESSFLKANEASLAMSKTLRDTTQAVLDQRKAFQEWERSASSFAVFFDNMKRLFGGGMQANVIENEVDAATAMVRNANNLQGGVGDLFGGLTGAKEQITALNEINRLEKTRLDFAEDLADVELELNSSKFKNVKLSQSKEKSDLNKERIELTDIIKNLETRQKKLSDDNLKNEKNLIIAIAGKLGFQKQVLDISTREAAGAENLLSITQNARDVARDYADQFITKTDVDKPLAVFRQATANILADTEKTKVSEEERTRFLNSIADRSNAISDIMSAQARQAFENTTSEEKRLKILEEEEKRFARQQELLKLQANTLKAIAQLQKKTKDFNKESTALIGLTLQMEDKKLQIATENAKRKVEERMNQADITETEMSTLKILLHMAKTEQDRADLAAHFLKGGKADLLDIMNAEKELNQANLDLELHRATVVQQSEKMATDVLMKRIKEEEKLLKLQQEGVMLEAQLDSFRARGTTKLTAVETAKIMVEAEKERRKLAEKKADIEMRIIRAQFALLRAQFGVLSMNEDFLKFQEALVASGGVKIDLKQVDTDLQTAMNNATEVIEKGLSNSISKFDVELRSKLESALSSTNKTAIKRLQDTPLYKTLDAFEASDIITSQNQAQIESLKKQKEVLQQEMKDSIMSGGSGIDQFNEIEKIQTTLDNLKTDSATAQFKALGVAIQNMVDALMQLGPEGVLAATIAEFGHSFVDTIKQMKEESEDGTLSTVDKLTAASSAIAGMAAIMSASSNAKIANIDREIEAEKKRDGKSKESQARIAALEKKKEAREKKAFDVNKKLMMAQTVVNTAAGVMATMKDGFWASPLAVMVAAMGAAQLALIAGTSYQGGGTIDQNAAPASITVGERNNRVDVSQGASAGELAYLRGQRGIGTNANNFQAMGGAAGLRKGYATGGEVLVGEQGPEVIKPLSPMQVVPNDALGGKPVSAHFTINAIDSQGVEDVLMAQQGNIISMIRSAANDYGEEFLETVNTDVYGTPKSGGGIDY